MLVDSLLPTTFWAEAVSTAYYVQNRVLVTKPHNKTPYELLHGSPPSISFMRPFGCHVTILNTLDPLDKFDEKGDEGLFVGYSINSKAFRVINTRIRKVKENLHINFLENKPNVAGSGPKWLFDIDLLINSMNYEPVTSSNDAVANGAGKKTNEEPAHEVELDNLLVQQKEGYANSTNRDSTVSLSVSTAGQNFTNADDLPTDPLIADLEDTGIFSGAYDDEDVGAEADLNNFEIIMNVSPILTTRIHKDHLKDQIIGDINSATQTRRMTKITEEHAMVWTLVDLPKGKRAIGTKWVYRSKKDERGIVFRYKARLVAQGYTQEERIDYDEFPGKVYKVEKALYGLHQAPRAWYETLSTYLLENGFRRGTIDKTLFIKKDKGDILLVQVYVDDIIFGSIKNSLCVEFEQMMHKKFQDEEAEDVDVHLYRSMIGSFMYLTASRPDIIFAICACTRFQVTPKSPHLNGVKRDFRYLKALQEITIGAEYVAAANCCGQVLWIQNQMLDYGFNFMNTKIHIDNESIICIVKNLIFHSKTKHIEIRHHFIRDSYEKKLIQVIKIHTDHNVADLLTKAFDVSSLEAEQDSGNINRTQSMATLNESFPQGTDSGSGPRCQDTILRGVGAQIKFEAASKQSNNPPLSRVNTLGSREDSIKLKN
ncbi:putative ribonuclease H-like domain-containing protein [Tanacetum coccineum]